MDAGFVEGPNSREMLLKKSIWMNTGRTTYGIDGAEEYVYSIVH
jgi:hypothetical protein